MAKIKVTTPSGEQKIFDWTSTIPPTQEDVEKLLSGGGKTGFMDQLGGAASYLSDYAMSNPWDSLKNVANAPFEMLAAPVEDLAQASAGKMGLNSSGTSTPTYQEMVGELAPMVGAGVLGGIPGGFLAKDSPAAQGLAEGVSKFVMGQLPNVPAMGVGFGGGAIGKAAAAFFAATGLEGAGTGAKAAWDNFQQEGATKKTFELIGEAGGNVGMAAAALLGLKHSFTKPPSSTHPVATDTGTTLGQPTVRQPSPGMQRAGERGDFLAKNPLPEAPYDLEMAPQPPAPRPQDAWTPAQNASYRKQFARQQEMAPAPPVVDRDFTEPGPGVPESPEVIGQPTVRMPSREMLDAAQAPPTPRPRENVVGAANWSPEEAATYERQFNRDEAYRAAEQAKKPVLDQDLVDSLKGRKAPPEKVPQPLKGEGLDKAIQEAANDIGERESLNPELPGDIQEENYGAGRD